MSNLLPSHHSIPMARMSEFSTVFIDFDGTIADNDVTDLLLSRFARPEWLALEEQWLAGKIGARQCMAEQISLMKATPATLNNCLDDMTIDPDFPNFIAELRRKNVKCAIVSDGLDYSIRHILKRYNLGDITIFANRLVYCGDLNWQLKFPYQSAVCPSGHCKCRRFDNLPAGFTLYIGDGASDYCPAQKADLVLAKNKLADYCQHHDIDYVRVDNFAQILAMWPHLTCETVQRRVAS